MPEAAMSSKVEPEVDVNCERPPFWILFSLSQPQSKVFAPNLVWKYKMCLQLALAVQWSESTSCKIQDGGRRPS